MIVSASAKESAEQRADDRNTAPQAPHEEQLKEFIEAKSLGDRAIQRLLEPVNTGQLDAITYRCLMLAHDQAFALGHRAVKGVHFLSALAVDDRGRQRLQIEEPRFNAAGVLRACAEHLVDEPPRLATEYSLPIGGELGAWIAQARTETLDREAQNQAIEVKHLVAALRKTSDQQLETLRSLLTGSPAPTLVQMFAQTKQRIDECELRILSAIGSIRGVLDDHDQKNSGHAKWLSQKLDAIHGRIHETYESVKGGREELRMVRTEAKAGRDGNVILHAGTQQVVEHNKKELALLTERRLLPLLFSGALVVAAAGGCSLAWLLRP